MQLLIDQFHKNSSSSLPYRQNIFAPMCFTMLMIFYNACLEEIVSYCYRMNRCNSSIIDLASFLTAAIVQIAKDCVGVNFDDNVVEYLEQSLF